MGGERPLLRTTLEVTCDAASGGKAPFVVATRIANRRATGNGADGRVRGNRATAGPELISGRPRVRPSPKPANPTVVAPRVGCRARPVSVRNVCRWDSTVRSATSRRACASSSATRSALPECSVWIRGPPRSCRSMSSPVTISYQGTPEGCVMRARVRRAPVVTASGHPAARRGHPACRRRTALVDTHRVFSIHLLLPLKDFNKAAHNESPAEIGRV